MGVSTGQNAGKLVAGVRDAGSAGTAANCEPPGSLRQPLIAVAAGARLTVLRSKQAWTRVGRVPSYTHVQSYYVHSHTGTQANASEISASVRSRPISCQRADDIYGD